MPSDYTATLETINPKSEIIQKRQLKLSRHGQDSHGEVLRLIDTFQIAAEEATRMYGAAQLRTGPAWRAQTNVFRGS